MTISLNIQQNLTTVNFKKFNGIRKKEWLVVHYYGAFGSAEENCAYFKSVYRKASAHYFVDDTDVWQSVKDNDIAWHCNDPSGIGMYRDLCNNLNSIGIEMRPYKINPKSKLAVDKDWYFHEETINRTIQLIKLKMEEYGIDHDHVIRHYDASTKWCPRPFIGDDINEYYKVPGNVMWARFKARLKEDDSEMTQEQFNQMMDEYLNQQKKQQPSDWSKEARLWAEDKKLILGDSDGNMQYKAPVTREQMIVFMQRLHNLK